MKRWRLLEKKRNSNGKFKPKNIKLYLKGDKVCRFATGGLVLPNELTSYIHV